MNKKNNKKGFTLAELLIVVAIIAVLTAVAIPVFSAQLEKARDATTIANIRSAYAMAQTTYLTETPDTVNGVTYAKDATTKKVTVEVPNVLAKGQNNTTPWSNNHNDLVIKDKLDGCSAMDNTPGTYKLTFVYDADGKIESVTATAT